MKSKYIHMSMLIQGPKQPGNNINLYLGLLQEELDTLWKTPAKTWDASKGEYFNMRAALSVGLPQASKTFAVYFILE